MPAETELTKRRREERESSKPDLDQALDSAGNLPKEWVKMGEKENQFSCGPGGLHVQGGNTTIQADKDCKSAIIP